MSRDHKQWTGFYMIKASVMKELRISVQIYMNIIYSNMNIILIALQTTHSLVKTKAVYFLNSQSFVFEGYLVFYLDTKGVCFLIILR